MITTPYNHINAMFNYSISELIQLEKYQDKIIHSELKKIKQNNPSLSDLEIIQLRCNNEERIEHKLDLKFANLHTICKIYPALILESFISMYKNACNIELEKPYQCSVCHKLINPEFYSVVRKYEDYLSHGGISLDRNVKKLIKLVMKFRHSTVHKKSEVKNVFTFGTDNFHSCVAIALSTSIHYIVKYTYKYSEKFPNSDASKIFGFATDLIQNTKNEVPNCNQKNDSILKIKNLIFEIKQLTS